ncbi:MAG: GAF domain-containing SpoIIE family protein phosphatase [Candidatus Neomarinimicrobiota bacterium]
MPENQFELDKLRSAVQELSVLNDIATAVSSARELDQVIGLIVHECVKHLEVEQGAVMLLDEKKPTDSFRTMVRKVDSADEVVPYHFGLQLSGWMLKNQVPLMINDFQSDTRFKVTTREDFPIRSLLSVPLKLKGKLLGVLNVFNKKNDLDFKLEDQRLLAIIATQSAQVIENARLYEEEQALMHFEEELRVAHDIQQNLLPKGAPDFKGFDICGRSIPAKEVGGDYFDLITISDDKMAVCLGDISGKGMPAALLMANLQATLRGQMQFTLSVSECISRSNKLLYQSTDSQKFATLFFGIINRVQMNLTYTNAGHDPPIMISSEGKIVRLETGGTVLGFMPDYEYKEENVSFQEGAVLVIYSDGVTDAQNDKDEDFGNDRLEEVIRSGRAKSAKEINAHVLNAVQSFTGDVPQIDDITLVVIKREPEDSA